MKGTLGVMITMIWFWSCKTCVTVDAQSAANFVIESCSQCEEVPRQKINLSIVLKNFVSQAQIMDISLITPVPLGNQLRISWTVDIETKAVKKKSWQHLFTVEDDFCRIVQMYIGELAYEVQTAMGIPQKSCPIPKGRYHAINYTMNFERLKLQTFPIGKLRIILEFLEKPRKNDVMCVVVIMNNV